MSHLKSESLSEDDLEARLRLLNNVLGLDLESVIKIEESVDFRSDMTQELLIQLLQCVNLQEKLFIFENAQWMVSALLISEDSASLSLLQTTLHQVDGLSIVITFRHIEDMSSTLLKLVDSAVNEKA